MNSPDLEDQAIANYVIARSWNRIEPEIDRAAVYAFVIQYYLNCVIKAPESSDFLHSRFEAARYLSDLMKHWFELGDRLFPSIELLVEQVTSTFLRGDRSVRNSVETGFLEHVFERQELVRFFSHWEHHDDLSQAFHAALEWGQTHRPK